MLELEHCWVTPARIGHGVGARLVAHAMATCRTTGATTLRIASDPFAEGFYRRMGAQRVGVVASTPRGRTLPLMRLGVGGAASSSTGIVRARRSARERRARAAR